VQFYGIYVAEDSSQYMVTEVICGYESGCDICKYMNGGSLDNVLTEQTDTITTSDLLLM
jgi:hypothetical protein